MKALILIVVAAVVAARRMVCSQVKLLTKMACQLWLRCAKVKNALNVQNALNDMIEMHVAIVIIAAKVAIVKIVANIVKHIAVAEPSLPKANY